MKGITELKEIFYRDVPDPETRRAVDSLLEKGLAEFIIDENDCVRLRITKAGMDVTEAEEN